MTAVKYNPLRQLRSNVFMSYSLNIHRKANDKEGVYFLADLKNCVFCSLKTNCQSIEEKDTIFFKTPGDWKNRTREIYTCDNWQPLPDFIFSKKEKKEIGILTANNDKALFFNSMNWKRTRAKVLEQQGAACQCCGRTFRDHGITLHVDHIVPISKNWSRRLDLDNLQVLCEDCNTGKGNSFSTDWRAMEKTTCK